MPVPAGVEEAGESGVVAFAAPVLRAAGVEGEATAVRVVECMGVAGVRERVRAVEGAFAEVHPGWLRCAEEGISSACPGWRACYDPNAGLWRARRVGGGGYYGSGERTRAFGVLAPGALWLFCLVERQALLDIGELFPGWHAWPSERGWCAVPGDGPARLLTAVTAAALAGAIAEEPVPVLAGGPCWCLAPGAFPFPRGAEWPMWLRIFRAEYVTAGMVIAF